MRAHVPFSLQKVRLRPHLYMFAPACKWIPRVRECTHPVFQQLGYDPSAPDARETEQQLGLPWDMRRDFAESGEYSGNQHRRPSGRFANSGSFKARAGLIFTASNKDWYFNLNNPRGEYSAHAYTAPYWVYIEGCGYDRT